MTPPISKDWWLAAALSTASLPTTMAQAPSAPVASTGVVTAVAPGGTVTGNGQVMVVGSSIVPGQRLRTDATGLLHVLFMDQSALTLGPNSELTIDEFSFDPATKQGQIRLGLVKGVVRVVGGQISKTKATTIATAHGKFEILGGIAFVDLKDLQDARAARVSGVSGVFLFGQSMTTTDNNGNSQTITRAGFGADLTDSGMTPPRRIPADELGNQIARLESRPNVNTAGNPNPPPAASGQLISTGNTPGGASNPGSALANDRLKNLIDQTVNANPSRTLQTMLGSTTLPRTTIQS